MISKQRNFPRSVDIWTKTNFANLYENNGLYFETLVFTEKWFVKNDPKNVHFFEMLIFTYLWTKKRFFSKCSPISCFTPKC